MREKKRAPAERHNAGFWVPDRFVTDHLEVIRPTGACVYLILASRQGLDSYPSCAEIAARLSLNPEFVREAVFRLARRGLITAAELVKVLGDPDALSKFNSGLTPDERAALDTPGDES